MSGHRLGRAFWQYYRLMFDSIISYCLLDNLVTLIKDIFTTFPNDLLKGNLRNNLNIKTQKAIFTKVNSSSLVLPLLFPHRYRYDKASPATQQTSGHTPSPRHSMKPCQPHLQSRYYSLFGWDYHHLKYLHFNHRKHTSH